MREFTKSRPRRCNDNAPCESENGSVARKRRRCDHIPARHAERVNAFNRDFLAPHLNFRRACQFPSERTDPKTGSTKNCYRHADAMTPREKLRPLGDAASYLKPGVELTRLEAEERSMTDLEAARRLNAEQDRLLRELRAEAA